MGQVNEAKRGELDINWESWAKTLFRLWLNPRWLASKVFLDAFYSGKAEWYIQAIDRQKYPPEFDP